MADFDRGVGVGGEVPARVPDPGFPSEHAEEPLIVLFDERELRLGIGLPPGAAVERRPDLAYEPRPAEARAPHHDGGGTGRIETPPGVGDRADVSVGDHRNPPRGCDRGDGAPVRDALVELLSGATVHRDRAGPERLRPSGEFGGVEVGVVPSEPHLDREGHGCGRRDRADDFGRKFEVAHQRRAGVAAGDALRRASHVDVDDVGAARRCEPGGLGHGGGLAPGELDDMRSNPLPFGAQPRLLFPAKVGVRGDHLGDHEACAETRRNSTEEDVRHARQRCEECARTERVPTDQDVSAQKFIRSHAAQFIADSALRRKTPATGLPSGNPAAITACITQADRNVQNAAVIVAGGRGVRAGEGPPKQYRLVGGRSVFGRTIRAFLSHPEIAVVQPVISAGDEDAFETVLAELADSATEKLGRPVCGGATRQGSVRAGLEALDLGGREPTLVLIHDAARPFADHRLIDRALAAGSRGGAAVPGIPVTDTIKLVSERGEVLETPPRDRLRSVQTPQVFAFAAVLRAHRDAATAGLAEFTDDGALAEWAGLKVSVFEGDLANIKLTRPDDFAEAERRLRGGSMASVARVGTGFDVHAFAEGDHVWLGGVRIPAPRGVTAHSDGDVVLHALTDALLGTISDGDIGVHFPPSDPQWRGASSDRFLADAARRVRDRGGRIDHLDVTVLCEEPRIGSYREEIRGRIAAIVRIPVGAVSIKATTTERLGFVGRAEGLAAQAVATVRLPDSAS